MGELQKRMKIYHDKDTYLIQEAIKAPKVPLNQYHHGYVKGFNEAERILFEIVEEMRKEFPRCNYSWRPWETEPFRKFYEKWLE